MPASDILGDIRVLLMQQRYKEAAALLDTMVSNNKTNDEFWYLKGIAALKLKNYERAQSHFERALMLSSGKKALYYQIKGMAHFEIFEIEEAANAFLKALQLDSDNATTNFFLGLCYVFMDSPKSADFMAIALKLDHKKTRQLLLNFYTLFLKDEPNVSALQKRNIEEMIRRIKK